MAQGQLEIHGTIDVAQFWPTGTSDADTAKILLTVDSHAFRYRRTPTDRFQPTQAFNGAKVHAPGQGTKPVISKDTVTVRLQGVDAAELHYRPQSVLKPSQRTEQQTTRFKELNQDYRQPLGETAAQALRSLLQPHGPQLPCRMITAVEKPSEVVDVYGRCVGDIEVSLNGESINLNQWLVQQGWAFPTFYSSMSEPEIRQLIQMSHAARVNKVGVWKNWRPTRRIDHLNLALIYRKQATGPIPSEEKGPVIMPKLFRRAITWKVNQMAKMVTGDLAKYLSAHPDDCYLTTEFLTDPHTARHRKLHEFYRPDGTFRVRPDELVFQEKPSELIGPNGKPVTTW